ncbi:MAG: ABC transporter permease subunit, partial [Bacteroidota bacterium]
MWQIIKNEWSALGRNRALLGISLGFLFVLLVSVVLGIRQNSEQTQRYQQAQKELREQWENIEGMNPHGAAHYGTYVFKPTNLLSSLDDGVNSVTGNVLRVEGHVQNEIVHSEASQMQAVSKFGKLKSSLLLQYILPLLLLFLAFNSVSSEKQSGRLKLLVLQGATPSSLIWGKTLSVWLYGMALLTLTVLVYAIMNMGSINAEIANRTLFFYLSYALYYFVITGLTVLISARWQSAT